MILKRRQSLESEESQPLESSHSSTISFGTFQDQCMFNDTDTTDCELDKSAKPASTLNQIQTPRKILLRRPFSYPSGDIYVPDDNVYEKYNYLTKSSGILNDNSYAVVYDIFIENELAGFRAISSSKFQAKKCWGFWIIVAAVLHLRQMMPEVAKPIPKISAIPEPKQSVSEVLKPKRLNHRYRMLIGYKKCDHCRHCTLLWWRLWRVF